MIVQRSPCGHYIRTRLEDIKPEIRAAVQEVFNDEPDLVERLNKIRELILAVVGEG